MAAARYWRLVGIETYGGGDLELSALQLYGSSGRVDVGATVTCSHAPGAGTLADLQDNDTETVCRFDSTAVRAGGFWLSWDFGSAVEVQGVRVGSGALEGLFIASCVVQFFEGGAWQTAFSLGRFSYPGAYTLIGELTFATPPILLLRGNGVSGSTTIVDSSPEANPITRVGSVYISDAKGGFGGASLFFPGDTSYLYIPNNPNLDFQGNKKFTIEARVYISSHGPDKGIFSNYAWVSNINYAQMIFGINPSGTVRFLLGGQDFSSTKTVPAGEFVHVSASVSATQISISVQGEVSISSRSSTPVPSYPGAHFIGAIQGYSSMGYLFSGYVEELIVTPGEALYLSDFTPPTSEFPHTVGPDAALALRVSTRRVATTVAASATVPNFSTRTTRALTARDIEFGGPGTIYGTTKTKGTPNTPTKARVVLLHQRSKLPVRETWSDPVTGAFVFSGIDTSQQFLALAEDAEGHFRPVAANRLTPEVP